MVGCRYMKKTLFLLGVLLLPSLALASFDVSLKIGSRGQAVTEMQDLLQEDGCLTTQPTGYFGFATLRAVKCFQTKYKLPASGYWGPQSRAQANKVLAAAKAESDIEEIATTGTTSAPIIVTPAMKVPPDTSALENKVSQLQAQLQAQSDQQIKIQQQQVQALQDANTKLQKIVETKTEAPPVPEKIVVPSSPKPPLASLVASINPTIAMVNGYQRVVIQAYLKKNNTNVVGIPAYVTSTEGFVVDVTSNNSGMYYYNWLPKIEGNQKVTIEVPSYGLKETFDYTVTPNNIVEPYVEISLINPTIPSKKMSAKIASILIKGLDTESLLVRGFDYKISSSDFTTDEIESLVFDGNTLIGNIKGSGKLNFQLPTRGIVLGISLNAPSEVGTLHVVIDQIDAVGIDSGNSKKLLKAPVSFDVTVQ